MFFTEAEIDALIQEDLPYIDLTTEVLGIAGQMGKISFFTREPAVVSGTEEAVRIFSRFAITPDLIVPSGGEIQSGDVFLSGTGLSENLHSAWKICQNLLDRCAGIATKTARLTRIVKSVNPHTEVFSTRKVSSGTKKLFIKSVMSGGGFPHRLGLSETVLVFRQHMNFMGGLDGLIERLPAIKSKVSEKKLIVEAETVADAVRLVRAGAEGIQFDKLSAEEVADSVRQLRAVRPEVVILAAGGIDTHNAANYAAAGVNAVVVTCLYNAPPVDVGVRIELL
ncbi:MAG: ModD protein [Oscillospiraceae bacterium]